MQIGSEPRFLIKGQFLSCKNIWKDAEEISPYFAAPAQTGWLGQSAAPCSRVATRAVPLCWMPPTLGSATSLELGYTGLLLFHSKTKDKLVCA